MADMHDAMKRAGLKPSKQPESRNRGDHGRSEFPKGYAQDFPVSYFATDDHGKSYLQSVFVSKKKLDPFARLLGSRANPRLTSGQMRRFFNHCREVERRVKIEGESWERVAASFEALCYHAQNAVSAHKIPKEFQDFIDVNVRRVVSDNEPERAFLDGFLPHFEALVGFGTAHMKRDS